MRKRRQTTQGLNLSLSLHLQSHPPNHRRPKGRPYQVMDSHLCKVLISTDTHTALISFRRRHTFAGYHRLSQIWLTL